ncbi:MAG: toxin-antitoxin system YwqK family antitoxin, partial [Methylotenera sp.]|nr:toxin-antitoxin system YwqK family antitoxin [Flavobacterium sp.]
MRIYFFLCIILMTVFDGNSQKRLKRVNYLESRQRTIQTDGSELLSAIRKIPIEIFYVLEEDTTLKDSLYIRYFETSKTIENQGYYKRGKKTGIWKDFFETADSIPKIKVEQYFKDDTLNGIYESCGLSGSKRLSCFYKNGKISGTMYLYYPTGEVESEVPHYKGLKNGDVCFFYEDGKLKSVERYVNGNKTGKFWAYSKEGRILQKGQYFDNEKTDTLFSFYDNGILKTRAFFANDTLNGPLSEFSEEAKITKQFNYKD